MRLLLIVTVWGVLSGFILSPVMMSQPLEIQNEMTGKIAFATWSGDETQLDIYVIHADGSGKVQLTDSPGNDYDMDWSPDGTQIIFRSDRNGFDQLILMDADGDNERVFLDSPNEQMRSPDWSSDGEWIAFAAYIPDADFPQNIHLVRADGTDRRQLTQFENPSFAEYPDWSPNGSQIAFLAATPSIKQVFVIGADGTGQTQLTEGSTDNDYPAWSPDGEQIVFKSERDGDREIYLMNADGTGQVNLTNSPDTEDTYPAWSPDGKQIVYFSDRPDQMGLFVMSVDGSAQTWIVEGLMPAWNGS